MDEVEVVNAGKMVYNKLHKERIDITNQVVFQQVKRILLSAIARYHIDIWQGATWGDPGLPSPELAFDTLKARLWFGLVYDVECRKRGSGHLPDCPDAALGPNGKQ
jgi:hypothetical protein